jgi:predicted MFS family arabinose efflux permease
LLAKAAAGPIWTKSSDIWGRKPALLISVSMFAAASMVAALSISMRMLIAARALQGVAAGGLFQLVSVTISDLVSVRKRALYFGWMGAMWAIAGTIGPLLGGVFAEKLTWRWCFWINLPICAFSFALLLLLLNVHNPRTRLRDGLQAIDWFGTASMLAVTVLLLLGLNFGGGTFAWNSVQVICLIVVGTCMIAAFIFSERRLAKYPLMPLNVFESVSNNATFVVAFGHNMVSIGAEFYLPLFFQSVRQASPLRSGLLLLPLTIAAASTEMILGIIINRTGRYREIIWTGVVLITLGNGLYIKFWTDTPLAEIIGIEVIGGAGVAFLFQSPMLAIHSTVKQADVASATASLGFLNNLATSLSVVIGGVVFQNSMTANRPTLAAAGLDDRVLDALAGDKAAANVNIVQTLADATQRRAVQDAFAGSVRNIFIMYTSIAAVTVLASVFIKQNQMSTEHTETRTGIENMTKREEVVST